ASSTADCGVIALLPLTMALMVRSGRPRIEARVDCVHPRASSSALMKTPGGNVWATRGIAALLDTRDEPCRWLDTSVVILDVVDDDHLRDRPALRVLFDLQDQAELVVEPHRALVFPLTLQLPVVERFQGVEVPLVGGRPDRLHPHAKGPDDVLGI